MLIPKTRTLLLFTLIAVLAVLLLSSCTSTSFLTDETRGTVGDTLLVPVHMGGVVGVRAYSIVVGYNPKQIRAIDVSTANMLTAGWITDYHLKRDEVRIAATGVTPLPAKGDIMNVHFILLQEGTSEVCIETFQANEIDVVKDAECGEVIAND